MNIINQYPNSPENSGGEKGHLPQTLVEFAEYYDSLARKIREKALSAMDEDELDCFLAD